MSINNAPLHVYKFRHDDPTGTLKQERQGLTKTPNRQGAEVSTYYGHMGK